MAIKIEYHPFVKNDLANADDHYTKVSLETFENLAEDFKVRVKSCLNKIKENPTNYFVIDKQREIRRAPIGRFPYRIIYRIEPTGNILVIAVLHFKQNDNHWQKR